MICKAVRLQHACPPVLPCIEGFISDLLEVVLDRITHISIATHNLGNLYPDWQYQNDYLYDFVLAFDLFLGQKLFFLYCDLSCHIQYSDSEQMRIGMRVSHINMLKS